MRLNIFFKCKTCTGTGWAAPSVPCQVCKGSGQVLHMFQDVIKVVEFPDVNECEDAVLVIKEEPHAPDTNSN
jgi:DnaJ-class molecular chaperone